MKKTANFTARIVPLEEVYTLSHQLSLEIMRENIAFDLVIAIARGGMLPARLFCDFLNIGQLTSLQIKHYTSGARQLESAKLLDPVRTSLKGKNVLLIDDVNDSGKTLRSAMEHVQTLEPALVKTAVIHQKKNDLFRADFVGNNLKTWKWLIYQWAATEDVLEFLQKDDMLESTPGQARNYLKETYELDIDSDLIRDILVLKNNYY